MAVLLAISQAQVKTRMVPGTISECFTLFFLKKKKATLNKKQDLAKENIFVEFGTGHC